MVLLCMNAACSTKGLLLGISTGWLGGESGDRVLQSCGPAAHYITTTRDLARDCLFVAEAGTGMQ